MWKNKHVVVALLVAPILSIFAWYAVDSWVGETPHAAKAGGAYKLVARSGCRYESGKCELVNNDFKVTLRPAELAAGVTSLTLDSEFALDQATVALVANGGELAVPAVPRDFTQPSTAWSVTIPATAEAGSTLRVAVTARETVYYAEVPVIFMTKE